MVYRGRELMEAVADFAETITGVNPRVEVDEAGPFVDFGRLEYILARSAELEPETPSEEAEEEVRCQ